jgi:antitoxin component of MazEF toxin-antitoxin module
MNRRVAKIGGSLGVLIPRDISEVMGVKKDSLIRLSLVGRQLIIEPQDDTASDASFRRAFATVLRRYGPTFEALAKFDRTPTRSRRR